MYMYNIHRERDKHIQRQTEQKNGYAENAVLYISYDMTNYCWRKYTDFCAGKYTDSLKGISSKGPWDPGPPAEPRRGPHREGLLRRHGTRGSWGRGRPRGPGGSWPSGGGGTIKCYQEYY